MEKTMVEDITNDLINICLYDLKMSLSTTQYELLKITSIDKKKKNYKDILNDYIKLDLLYKKILVESYYNKQDKEVFLIIKRHFSIVKEKIKKIKNKKWQKIMTFYLGVSVFNNDILENKPYSKKIENPKISVILPTYNSEDYIIDSITSILNQSFQDFELIIVNECDTFDETLKYIKIFQDKRIKIINTDKKLGLAESLNLGIKKAKGKYIARIDADDISLVNRLEEEYYFLDNNPEIAVCASWQEHFSPDYIWIHKTPFENEKIKALLLFECCICHSTVMIRRQTLLDNNYFYDSNIRQEDYELWCRMSFNCNFYVIPKVLGYYRIHNSNITKKQSDNLYKSQIDIIKNNLKKLDINEKDYNEELLIGLDYIYNKKPFLRKEAYKLFDLILEKNQKLLVYDQEALKYALNKRKKWIKNAYSDFNNSIIVDNGSLITKIKREIYPIYNFVIIYYNKIRIINKKEKK